MADTIRVYMDTRPYYPDPTQTVYEILVQLPGDEPPVCLLATRDRKSAFSRYNALAVEKEPDPEQTTLKEDESHG